MYRTRTMRTLRGTPRRGSKLSAGASDAPSRCTGDLSSHLAFVTRRLPLSIYAPPVPGMYLHVQLYDLST